MSDFLLDFGVVNKEYLSYGSGFHSLKSQYYGSLHLTNKGFIVSNIYHAALMKPENLTPYYMDRERDIDMKYIGSSDVKKKKRGKNESNDFSKYHKMRI